MASGRILLVDDDPVNRELLRARLQHAGYEVMEACDGEEGLAVARRQRPDCVILDVMMPKIDGMTVCGLLKFDSAFRDMPVVLLTARASTEDRKMGLEAGADAFLVKPVDAAAFLSTVSSLLEGRSSDAEQGSGLPSRTSA